MYTHNNEAATLSYFMWIFLVYTSFDFYWVLSRLLIFEKYIGIYCLFFLLFFVSLPPLLHLLIWRHILQLLIYWYSFIRVAFLGYVYFSVKVYCLFFLLFFMYLPPLLHLLIVRHFLYITIFLLLLFPIYRVYICIAI